METLETLMKHGMAEFSARRMLDAFADRIGSARGCLKITDIAYLGDGVKDAELTCTECGAVYHSTVYNNKWNKIRHTCSCQNKKNKLLPIKPGVMRNDDPSYLHQVYGDYEVVDFVRVQRRPAENGAKTGGAIFWMCKCQKCGDVVRKVPCVVRSGGNKCGCTAAEEKEKLLRREIGQHYGRLTIVGLDRKRSGKNKKIYAMCECDCGGTLVAQLSNIKTGRTKSCGCLEEELIKQAKGNRDMARSRSPLYGTWSGMRSRCFNKNNQAYKDYGGRGITVCDEWLGPEGFDRFEKWAYENGYEPERGLSLDRIDVNGNYCPENCRYASIFVQAVNQRPAKRRPVKTYCVDGEELTLNQLCKKYNISSVAVRYRIKTLGMDLETALKTPKTRKGNIYAGEQAHKRVSDINKCSSYIEANLYLAFIRNTAKYELEPQFTIGKYHADFIICGTNIIIECDGYDHHKTKEQIALDYERERFFISKGYTILRYSGTEINKDPDACCKEIISIADAYYENRQTDAG